MLALKLKGILEMKQDVKAKLLLNGHNCKNCKFHFVCSEEEQTSLLVCDKWEKDGLKDFVKSITPMLLKTKLLSAEPIIKDEIYYLKPETKNEKEED